MRRCFLVLLLVGSLGLAQTAKKAATKGKSTKAATHTASITTPETVKWGDAPPVLSPGAQFAVLTGNPAGTGEYVVRLKMPDGFKIMPHWHPTQENVSVISGEFHVGMGDKFDETGMQALQPGSFAAMPAHMHHFAVAKGETIVQVNGIAPFKLNYVNPSDDPSKKK